MKDGWRVVEVKKFVLPSLPPSVNSVYQIIFAQRRVEMKPEVRLWKTQAKEFIPRMTPLQESHLFRLNVVFHYDFFFKNGKVRKFDTHNLMKVLQDAVAEKNGFDDSLIKFNVVESYHSGSREFAECELQQVTNCKLKQEIPHESVSNGEGGK